MRSLVSDCSVRLFRALTVGLCIFLIALNAAAAVSHLPGIAIDETSRISGPSSGHIDSGVVHADFTSQHGHTHNVPEHDHSPVFDAPARLLFPDEMLRDVASSGIDALRPAPEYQMERPPRS